MDLTVIIVDDDPTAAYLLERLIKHQKISNEVTVLSGGSQALDYFRAHEEDRTRYLVFLDINMPDMTGWQLIEAIERRPCASRIGFLIVSSSIDQTDHDRIANYPSAIAFLEKPVSRKMLEEIKELIGHSSGGTDHEGRRGSR